MEKPKCSCRVFDTIRAVLSHFSKNQLSKIGKTHPALFPCSMQPLPSSTPVKEAFGETKPPRGSIAKRAEVRRRTAAKNRYIYVEKACCGV
ncbi:MAG: hypothetical protein II871_07690 [Clostridia bacterium]|nr:hypothetical protein [Clostridia bacterium]